MVINETRKWQNLLYCKCPNCDAKMEDKINYFACPNEHETDPSRSCFFIKKEKAASYLLDKNHPAHFCLKPEEKDKIEEVINKMNIKINES